MTRDGRNGDGEARAGEVIEASTGEFTAECYRNADPPPLGSLVTTSDGDVEIFGVVHHAAATGLDRSRPVAALGEDADTEADLRARHPELTELLRAEFSAVVVGHRDGAGVSHVLPPRPARLHGFVHVADAAAVREFTRSPHYLANLVRAASLGRRPRRRGLRPPRRPRPPRPRRLPPRRGQGDRPPPRPRRPASEYPAPHDG